ncbi:hypothetical protein LTR10_016627 [Elasticomyces elasticus]|uniref:Chromo domain-containing protein n=1 Tax=Exophiala sideris TaxID=1016849 RepID=A0ABR0JLQ3_9EURO|nr:hypothetical protein LTR10_016627 [Elasticomyces elasticus]KAK5035272.1 hypothetical protein LTS07_002708 [Exophiala sideris]KAK5066196.1 hypothetical protein LTR69_002714 [Exophiala sideris]KAK5186873.1 hypothetical protein LTR44_000879 [Eurotiomycetes sp. CCFEE 6388]
MDNAPEERSHFEPSYDLKRLKQAHWKEDKVVHQQTRWEVMEVRTKGEYTWEYYIRLLGVTAKPVYKWVEQGEDLGKSTMGKNNPRYKPPQPTKAEPDKTK